MTDQNLISIDPSFHFGKPCIAGKRIPVQSVVELLQEGVTAKQIVAVYYPELSVEQINACGEYTMKDFDGYCR